MTLRVPYRLYRFLFLWLRGRQVRLIGREQHLQLLGNLWLRSDLP